MNRAYTLNRRGLLAGIGATGLAATSAGLAEARSRRRFFERLRQPLGLQFGITGTDAGRDLDASYAQVAEIGFREVELSNLFGKTAVEHAAAATRSGVKIASLHLPLIAMGGPASLSMASEPARIADAMGTLGAKWGIVPILMIPSTYRPRPGERMETGLGRAIAEAGEDIWKQTAASLNSKAAALQPLGVGVAYHNHNLDFAPIGKTTGWDILLRETDPGLVKFEIDIGWVELAGLDPVRFLDRLRGRVKLLHVRDMIRDKPQSFEISMNSPIVGSGRLDWARILPAAWRAGARHFIVEQEATAGITSVEAVRQSFAYLSQIRA
jgi:sugar phosphate isomerase/epimerase